MAGVMNPGSRAGRAYKTKLPSGANTTPWAGRSTPIPYSPVWNGTGIHPAPIWNGTGIHPAPIFPEEQQVVPQYGDWADFAAGVETQKALYPNANQTVAGAPAFGETYNRFNRYAGATAPGGTPAATPLGGTPAATGAPAYEPRWDVDAYDNPIDPNWWQNNANTLEWVGGEEGYAPRPGVPEAAALKDYANIQAWEAENDKKWTSTYTPEWYSQQYIQDKTYGIAGGTNRKGTTQLQYGRKQPDWVNRILKANPNKPRDTNKTYDQSILEEGTPAAKMSYPAWAGQPATWRT